MVMTFTCNYRLHRRTEWSALRPAIFNVMQSILVKLSGIDNKDIESKNSTIFAFHITLKVHYNTLQSGLTIKC